MHTVVENQFFRSQNSVWTFLARKSKYALYNDVKIFWQLLNLNFRAKKSTLDSATIIWSIWAVFGAKIQISARNQRQIFELSRQKSKFRNTDDLGHFGQENSNCIYGLNICNFACFCAKIRIYREYRNLEFWRENSNEPIWCDLHTLWVLRFVVSGNLSSCIRPFKARFWFVVLVVVVVVQ